MPGWVMPEYRYCGLGLAVDFPLPDVSALTVGADVDLRIQAGAVPSSLSEITNARAGLWSRNDREVLWELPTVGRFHIREAGRVIQYQCAPHADDDTVALFLLEVLFPLARMFRGDFMLRASAVCRPDGEVVAFTGSSAVGKSTEAAQCIQQGARLVSDSLLRLTVTADGAVLAHPQGRVLTLWPDMLAGLSWAERDGRLLRKGLNARQLAVDAITEPKSFGQIIRLRTRDEDATSVLAASALNRLQLLQQLTVGNVWLDNAVTRRGHFLWSAAILNRCAWHSKMRTELVVIKEPQFDPVAS